MFGTEMHVNFERRLDDGSWQLIWDKDLSEHWYENFIDSRGDCDLTITMAFDYIKNKEISVRELTSTDVIPNPTIDEDGVEILTAYCQSLSPEYIKQNFEWETLVWDYNLPKLGIYIDKDVDYAYRQPEITRHDYIWFDFLKEVAHEGLPKDISAEGFAFCLENRTDQYFSDRTFHYIATVQTIIDKTDEYASMMKRLIEQRNKTLSEIIGSLDVDASKRELNKRFIVDPEEISKPIHIKWLETFIDDPVNTRMIFYFNSNK